MIAVAEVALDARSSGALDRLTYLNPHGAKPGQIVLAPLGVRSSFGVVLSVGTVEEAELPVALEKMRSLSPAVTELDLFPAQLDLAHFVSRETLSSVAATIALMIPPGIRDRLTHAWSLTETKPDPQDLTAIESEVLATMGALGGTLLATKTKPIEAAALRALRRLKARGFVQETLGLSKKSERSGLSDALRLTTDEDRIQQFLTQQGRKKPAQALAVMRLQGAEGTRFSPQEIKALSGVTDQTLRALMQAGLLERAPADDFATSVAPRLAPQQVAAVDAIQTAIREHADTSFLLFGVTGSGKTEVYMHAAEEALRRGRQVLYLVPEIALTAQVIGQLRGRFGGQVAVLHSALTPSERLEQWLRIKRGEAAIILGARSALFAPMVNLGLIVMDEEHEQSYKQESTPRYHSKRVAQFLATRHRCPLVLGSATPSIETFWEAQIGECQRLDMLERAASARLPEIEVVDLAQQFQLPGQRSMIGPALREKIEGVLERREQAILFLNRRAYAPYLSCRECGHAFQCPECSVSLSYHKADHRLVCHYCGFHMMPPSVCPKCEGTRLAFTGAGSEKLEEMVRTEFPSARVARLDRDQVRKKGALEETFALMRAGEIDLLVGTQMIAKGLDFPGVTLVGVIVADVALHLPDFRASERTFQLLTQVAGRSGRGAKPGEVVIQTFSPDHPAVQFAQQHDYLGLFETLIEEREQAHYPPFNRLVNVVLSGPDRPQVQRASDAFAQAVRGIDPAWTVLGPVDCSIERLQGQWRRHVIVKGAPGTDFSAIQPIAEAMIGPKLHVLVDVDPYSMM